MNINDNSKMLHNAKYYFKSAKDVQHTISAKERWNITTQSSHRPRMTAHAPATQPHTIPPNSNTPSLRSPQCANLLCLPPPSMMQDAESKSETSQAISAREHFVFTDTDGQVYHITVEGNAVKDGARIPPDVSPPDPWRPAQAPLSAAPLRLQC